MGNSKYNLRTSTFDFSKLGIGGAVTSGHWLRRCCCGGAETTSPRFQRQVKAVLKAKVGFEEMRPRKQAMFFCFELCLLLWTSGLL